MAVGFHEQLDGVEELVVERLGWWSLVTFGSKWGAPHPDASLFKAIQ